MSGPGASRPIGARRHPVVRIGLAVATIGWLLTAALPAPGSAAVSTWIVTLAPTSIDVDEPTTVVMTFANLGGLTGNDDLGCVRLVIPTTFKIGTVSVISSPVDTAWKAVIGGQTVIINTSSGGDRLPWNDPSAEVVTAISVTPNVVGSFTWTATPYRSQACNGTPGEVASLPVLVRGKVIPTPTPTPTPTPILIPTPTPTPIPTPTPTPTPTLPPGATPTPPIATPPAATPAPGTTPEPTRSPSPSASSGANPSHSPPPGLGDLSGGPGPSGPPVGAGLLMPGLDEGPSGGLGGGGTPTIDLTSGFETPFGEGFAWAVPGLVLSVPGLFLVLAVIGAQAIGAFAWLPVVRRRIGAFGIRRRPLRRDDAGA